MPSAPVILWFRRDLRLQDNPALLAAHQRSAPIIPVYIHDESDLTPWAAGAASRWWLHHSLSRLDESLRERGSRLVIISGKAAAELDRLRHELQAGSVYWNRCYEPAAIARDREMKRTLSESGCDVRSFNSALLFEPHTITNKSGGPFQVFTPYWRHCLTLPVEPATKFNETKLAAPNTWPESLTVNALGLLPRLKWADEFPAHWQPGESGAQQRLKQFLSAAVDDYDRDRNTPEHDGTSRLSPWLHFGEIGPRQIWQALRDKSKGSGVFPASAGAKVFLSEVGWREFAHHLLYHFPHTPAKPLRADFAKFPWAKDPGAQKLRAWQRGLTGYPIVDAGMRQLWRTGWMHNRVRMIVASFLVKHLRLSWQEGAAWFWDTLVDADLANNTLGWQWSAGCGADAAPYFRIFAPVTQGERFDAAGDYVRRWVPELANMPPKWIHQPWNAPLEILQAAGVRLGDTYPQPLVDHATARAEALAAFKELRGTIIERDA
jgi:deoxyribodipyrimidine photo-lyase